MFLKTRFIIIIIIIIIFIFIIIIIIIKTNILVVFPRVYNVS